MANKFFISPSPHVHGDDSTRGIMADVILALVPALVVSTWVLGFNVLLITAVSVVSCVLFEYLIQKYMLRGRTTVGDLSAVVTGVLLAFNLPASIPWWIVVIGAFVAIGIGKMTFGGLGKNPFNPALTGRIFLLIAYPVQMTSFAVVPAHGSVDAFSGATMLTQIKESGMGIMDNVDFMQMLGGVMNGSMGEIGALALILGGIYLLWRKVITWHIPVAVLGTMAVFAAFAGMGHGSLVYELPLFHLLAGGALLGAIFMATDYSTSPMTHRGMLIYGVGIGALTMIIRLWGSYPEGMSFAIFIMNATVPLINKYCRPVRFGVKTKK
ncbi:MAG: RnfABCDGE type electron transport complex subunit D [Alistipes sp.]|nr:RnfABCDGE type electron transport complex subunit D [Alistipes sp.]